MNLLKRITGQAQWVRAGLAVLLASVLLMVGPARAAETVTYVYTDVQGTVLAKADAAGNLVSVSDYRPYGAQAMGAPEDGPGFTGHVNDPDSGLVYMQARYYDPAVGRFISIDPVGLSKQGGDKFNRYWYANNNPVVLTDPTGMDTVGENIDEYASQAAADGSGVRTYAWAFAATAWKYLGAEEVSQWADKGSSASGGDKAMAVVSVVTLGKGSAAEKGLVSASSGVYRIVFSNGKSYIGKGLSTRMLASMRRILKVLNKDKGAEKVTVDELEFMDVPGGSREAFKEESRMIDAAGGSKAQNPDSNLINQIDSPGKKYRKEDGELDQ